VPVRIATGKGAKPQKIGLEKQVPTLVWPQIDRASLRIAGGRVHAVRDARRARAREDNPRGHVLAARSRARQSPLREGNGRQNARTDCTPMKSKNPAHVRR
jgi:hypothetical protein